MLIYRESVWSLFRICKSCLKLLILQCTSVYLFGIGISQFRIFNLTITSFFLTMYFMIDTEEDLNQESKCLSHDKSTFTLETVRLTWEANFNCNVLMINLLSLHQELRLVHYCILFIIIDYILPSVLMESMLVVCALYIRSYIFA